MQVINMRGPRGNAIANQFIIYGACVEIDGRMKEGTMFQSYEPNIAFILPDDNTIYLGEDWNYSITTGKYRNMFLGIDIKELRARIKDGRAIIMEEL